MPRVWVSLGSNLDPEQHLRGGLASLRATFGPLVCSSVYRTVAVGFDGPDFLNMVAGFDTALAPERVRELLRRIEESEGRERGGARFSSRTLDLDLLTYGNAVIERPPLHLPRAEILEQPFVLGPLAEVAPDELHVPSGSTYGALWRQMSASRAGSLTPVELVLAPYCCTVRPPSTQRI